MPKAGEQDAPFYRPTAEVTGQMRKLAIQRALEEYARWAWTPDENELLRRFAEDATAVAA